MAWTDAPKKVPTPDEIMLGGIRYLNAKKAAEECDFSYQGLLKRINNNEIPGAKKHSPGKGFQAVWYVPENELPTEKRKPGKPSKAEQEVAPDTDPFPSLNRNADGVPAPKAVDRSLPAVKCQNCPHHAEKTRACNGLIRNAKAVDGKETNVHYTCHKVGRLIVPIAAWLEKQPEKPYTGPELKTANDLPLPQAKVTDTRHEHKAVQIVAEKAAETPKPTMPELQNIEKAFGNFKSYLDTVIVKPSPSPLHQALLYLESQVTALDEEAAELETALDSLADRAKRAKAAIEAIRAFEGMETEATR